MRISARPPSRRRWLTYAGVASAVISGLAGVLGALVGAGATLLAVRLEGRAAAARERRSALVGFGAAVFQLGNFYSMYRELMPADASRARRLWSQVGLSGQGSQLVARFFYLLDAYWTADIRLRTIASPEELEAVSRIEDTIADWEIGEPLPEGWSAAVRELRELVTNSA